MAKVFGKKEEKKGAVKWDIYAAVKKINLNASEWKKKHKQVRKY